MEKDVTNNQNLQLSVTSQQEGMGGFPDSFLLKISSCPNLDYRGWDLISRTTKLKIIPRKTIPLIMVNMGLTCSKLM